MLLGVNALQIIALALTLGKIQRFKVYLLLQGCA